MEEISKVLFLSVDPSERRQALSCTTELTSHWLVAATCPTHSHSSCLRWVCVTGNRPLRALQLEASTHEECSHIKRPTANSQL